MKVSIEHISEDRESELIIKCYKVDESVRKVLHFLEYPARKLFGEIDDEKYILDPGKVLYVESQDRKVYIHGEQQVYVTRKKIYELEEDLSAYHFFRASKWMILNIRAIVSVRPLIDGRFEASLKTGEKVFISRKYVPVLKTLLGISRRK